jgi:glycosyltransferase involved in cell wall biosynthesis
MILIDALHINNSGGKVLLDYLIDSIEKTNLKVFYLLDERIIDKHPLIKKNQVFFLKANFKNRFLFYIKNKNKFHKILCFGNIPPPIRLNAKTYTYFHQRLFIKTPKNLSFNIKIKLFIKSKIIKLIESNTDFWIVQTSLMKVDFLSSFTRVISDKVLIIPFYPSLSCENEKVWKRVKERYLFVSTYNSHKNFENLIEGFKMFYDTNKKGELHLTLIDDNSDIIKVIKKLIVLGYPIFNHGFVKRVKLIKLYRESEFIIYPSFSESFGLGIIEGLENGCNVIGADLKYLNSVCKPSLVFNPYSQKSIAEAFQISTQTDIKRSVQLVFNEINNLIRLLK